MKALPILLLTTALFLCVPVKAQTPDTCEGIPQYIEEVQKNYIETGDYKKALKALRKLSKESKLRNCEYLNEVTPLIDHIKEVFVSDAYDRYGKDATNGVADAQYKLANCFLKGENGLSQDLEEAVRWFSKAAELGYAPAQYMLGKCYKEGECGYHNDDETVFWFTKAANQGNADAQYELAMCYEHAYGVEQSYGEAGELLTKAAEQGHAEAQNRLGEYYQTSLIGKRDYNEAVKWYRKAAEQGNARAKSALERLEENEGPAVPDTQD